MSKQIKIPLSEYIELVEFKRNIEEGKSYVLTTYSSSRGLGDRTWIFTKEPIADYMMKVFNISFDSVQEKIERIERELFELSHMTSKQFRAWKRKR